jgi:hypothetical protein
MPSTITFTSANILPGSNNSILVYNFPSSVVFSDHSIAVSQVNMFYSWENINGVPLQNNKFSYSYTSVGTTTTYNLVIPDGIYEISDINNFLQFSMIANGTYLVNDVGQNVYYAEFILNPTLYSVQINTYPQLTILPVGWTNPSGLPLASAVINPVITLPAKFNLIMGFPAGYATPQPVTPNTIFSVTSTSAPQVQPNPTVFVTMSNIQNIYAIPSSIIYAITPIGDTGTQIADRPYQYSWNKLLAGTYNQLRIQLLGTDLGPIEILDPTMTIILLIQDNKLEGHYSMK